MTGNTTELIITWINLFMKHMTIEQVEKVKEEIKSNPELGFLSKLIA